MTIPCRICGAPATKLFTARVLGELDVGYYQCTQCRLVQTEEPYWLDRAYRQPIGDADTGQIERSLYAAVLVESLLERMQLPHARVVDYGAGYGLLVRLLRNAGIDAYWSDRYADNLFAKDAVWSGGTADLVTGFKVAEHFVRPLEEFERMLAIGRTILISTVLVPSPPPPPSEWAYYALDGGQHVSLYTIETLGYLAQRFGLALYSNGHNLHLLTDRQLDMADFSTDRGWNALVARVERTFSPVPLRPSFEAVLPSNATAQPSKKLIGIAIFHGLGDIVNATIIARQIKADHPDAHLVWFIAERYAFVLEGNPDVDEVVALSGDPKQLDARIEELRASRPWDRFYVPAPYMAYDKLPGGDLTELMLATYDGTLTVPLRPVIVLNEREVERARSWWAQLPPDRLHILVETEFFSDQSPWDRSYALDMVRRLAPLRPVFVFTAKNRPPYLDELAAEYPDVVWCDLPFRLNAELYNLCDAFVGVSSGISCLSNSTWCRPDVPHIEVVGGPHWSSWHFRHHTRRRICFDRVKYHQALDWLADVLSGKSVEQRVEESSLLELYTHRIEGKYRFLSPHLLPDRYDIPGHKEIIRAIVRTLEECPPFYFCYGGIGDFLLALSTALDRTEPITVVTCPNSIAAARAFFDCFPQIERVVVIPRHRDALQQYVAGMFLRHAVRECRNVLGCGVTPPAREDDFWKPGLDIVRQCGVTLYPTWVQRYHRDTEHERPLVVLAPMGSLSGMFRSKRNIVPPHYWQPLLELLRRAGIRPVVIGTPAEAQAYPSDGWALDRRSTSFDEQFRILASADIVIAADSWHKTFAAMAGVPTIVFAPLVNHDLAFWQDSSHHVFIAPWKNIRLVRSWDDTIAALRQLLAQQCDIELDTAVAERYRPPERPRRTNPQQPLTSFHPLFWERHYEQARTVHIRLPDAIGDALMITAVTRELKSQYPHVQVSVAASEVATEVFGGNPDIDRAVITNSPDDLRCEANADIVVDYRCIIDQLPEYYGILPMMDILANIAGIRLTSKRIVYTPTDDEHRDADELTSEVPGPLVAFHLTSSKDPLRSYLRQRELLEQFLRREPSACVLWLGTEPAPLRSDRVLDVSGAPLRRQIALAQRCAAGVVVDSVFYHVLHNLWRKPTVLIAGPTSEYLIGDYTAAPLTTIRAYGCSACYWHTKHCKRICMALINPTTIAAAASGMVERLRNGTLNATPMPGRQPLRCRWDSLQRHLYATMLEHRARGGGLVTLEIVADGEPLPPYADRWNGVALHAQPSRSVSSLSKVFQP